MTALALASNPRIARQPTAAVPAFSAAVDFDFEAIRAEVAFARRTIRTGQYVYHAGQEFQMLYLVRSGVFKSVQVTDQGDEQVTGFRMRGDILGVDSIGAASYGSAEIALEDSEVWVVQYAALRSACARKPELHNKLMNALGAEIRRDRSWMLMQGTLCAEQRVAAFLLGLSSRSASLGLDGERLELRMSRAEIGSYLSLTLETVTRAMSHLAARQLIGVQRRQIRILQAAALRRLIGCSIQLH